MTDDQEFKTRAHDWRLEYVICEHVAADEAQGTKHRGFRVCCNACELAGFLTVEPLEVEELENQLAIGRMKGGQA